MNIFGSMALGAGLMVTLAAQAAVVTVTPADPSWTNPFYENSVTGSSSITGTVGRSGNGSVEMFGDRTRYLTGNQYNPASNLTALSNVTGLSFDWRVAGDSVAQLDKDYTPALRLHVQDGAVRSELIWEGAYNNLYGNESKDTWYTTSFQDLFYQNISGPGVTLSGGSQVNKTLQAWISDNYSASAYVTAISVGVGGSAGTGYHAFADNVVLGERTGNTTFNFETAAATAVPEPASFALLGAGMVGLFAAGRSRRR